jgi:Leucine Rich repeat
LVGDVSYLANFTIWKKKINLKHFVWIVDFERQFAMQFIQRNESDKLVSAWMRLEKCLENTAGDDVAMEQGVTKLLNQLGSPSQRDQKQSSRPITGLKRGRGASSHSKIRGSLLLSEKKNMSGTNSSNFYQRPTTAGVSASRGGYGSRPKTSMPGASKRPMTSGGGNTGFVIKSSGRLGSRPLTGARSQERIASGLPRQEMIDFGLAGEVNPENPDYLDTKLIHRVPLRYILEIYEAKCQDTECEYYASQAKYFIQKFENNCAQRKLTILDSSMGIKCAQKIADLLWTNEHFTSANMSKNTFGDIGAALIADALRVNTTLIHLDLTSNNIGPDGMLELFRALRENSTLYSLNLQSGCKINNSHLNFFFNSFIWLSGLFYRSEFLKYLPKGFSIAISQFFQSFGVH